MSSHELHLKAVNAFRRAYAKYSKFYVGAAVLCEGEVFSGCNIENASYGATVCAERVAIWKAISEKGPDARISKLCLVTKAGDIPCGMCLQVMSEFMDGESEIFLCSETEIKSVTNLNQLLPKRFVL